MIRDRNKPLLAYWLLAIGFLLGGCVTPTPVLKPGYDPSQLRRLAVMGLGGDSVDLAVDEFTRQLLKKGYSVQVLPLKNEEGLSKALEDQRLDGVFVVSVFQFEPNRRYLVQSVGGSKSSTEFKDSSATGTNPQVHVIPIHRPAKLSGRTARNWGPPMGFDANAQIVVSDATIGLSARLLDGKTGEAVWSESFTYEGLDIQSAAESSVRYLLRFLPDSR